MNNYQKYLQTSFQKHNALINEHGFEWGNIETLYIGGGTPSLWGESGIGFLGELMSRNGLRFKDNYEFTVELNPGSWKKKKI